MKRKLTIVLALCLALALGIGGTVAYLTATTGSVTNTFTIGKVGLTLTETEGTVQTDGSHQFKMVPGNTIAKDPTVTVTGGSEDCWLFIKLEKSENFDKFLTYAVPTGEGEWTELPGYPGYYYRQVAQANSDQSFQILEGTDEEGFEKGVVKVLDTVENFKAETEGAAFQQPTLTISAAAIQQANTGDVGAAFKSLPGTFTGLKGN